MDNNVKHHTIILMGMSQVRDLLVGMPLEDAVKALEGCDLTPIHMITSPGKWCGCYKAGTIPFQLVFSVEDDMVSNTYEL